MGKRFITNGKVTLKFPFPSDEELFALWKTDKKVNIANKIYIKKQLVKKNI